MAAKDQSSAALPPGETLNGCIAELVGCRWTTAGAITPHITGSHIGSAASVCGTMADIVATSA